MTFRLKILAPNGAICGTVMSRSATSSEMPLCGVAYVKNLSTTPLGSRPASGQLCWIMLRQIRPPMEWATSHTLGAPVLSRTRSANASRPRAAAGRS